MQTKKPVDTSEAPESGTRDNSDELEAHRQRRDGACGDRKTDAEKSKGQVKQQKDDPAFGPEEA